MTKDEARNRCMKLCSTKEYAPGDIENKLQQWGIDDVVTGEIIEYLRNEKFLDEFRYARYFTNDKIRFNKWGKYKVSLMLKQKGIAETAIREALGQFSDDEYHTILENELKKKRKSIKDTDDYIIRGKLTQFAVGKGFEPALANEVISRVVGK